MDPQEWEAQALDALDAWAERTGTDTSSKTYQHRLKSITMKAQADMRAQAVEASGRAGAPDKKSSKVNFDPIKKWAHYPSCFWEGDWASLILSVLDIVKLMYPPRRVPPS